MPPTGAARGTGVPSPPIPAHWWVAGAVYLVLMGWLATRTRVYIDEVWIVEYGRRLLGGEVAWSMYMRADGGSPMSWAWLGTMLAEAGFRLGGLWPFRFLAAVAALVAAFSLARLAQAFGAPCRLAALVASALLIDPALLQSVQLGRPDTLALALLGGGLLLATRAVERLRAGAGGWPRLALGYGLCAVAPAAWGSALLVGPLAALHWVAMWRSLARQAPAGYTRARATVAFLLVPTLVFAAAVVRPALSSLESAGAGDTWLLLGSYRDLGYFLGFLAQELAVSAALVMAGLVALAKLRPRWLAGLILAGAGVVLVSGFYQFRIPYLMVYLAAAAALYSAQATAAARSQWTRLLVLVVAVSGALFAVRLGFARVNEPPPAAAPFIAALPRAARIADYSWDFYAWARQDGRPVMRSMPLTDDDGVVAWLQRTRPDVVVSAIDPTSTWMLVFRPEVVFAAAGYCVHGEIDWNGDPVSSPVRRRPPTPLLWKLGLFRDHGPYRVWVPCRPD